MIRDESMIDYSIKYVYSSLLKVKFKDHFLHYRNLALKFLA